MMETVIGTPTLIALELNGSNFDKIYLLIRVT